MVSKERSSPEDTQPELKKQDDDIGFQGTYDSEVSEDEGDASEGESDTPNEAREPEGRSVPPLPAITSNPLGEERASKSTHPEVNLHWTEEFWALQESIGNVKEQPTTKSDGKVLVQRFDYSLCSKITIKWQDW